MPASVFFSYARAESDRVFPLARELMTVGIDVWVDQWRLIVGRPWDDLIMAEIGSREVFIVALTEFSVTRDEVKNEIAEALRRGKWVIPVLFEPCVLPHRIARLHQCRLYPSQAAGLRKLLKDLGMTFNAEARNEIEKRRTNFIQACQRPSNISPGEWTDPKQKFLAALEKAQREDAPLDWYEVLEAGRELRDVMSRVPEGEEGNPHPGHSAPMFSPLVILTDAIDKNLAGVATGENLTGAGAIGLLEQSVSEADQRLISERRKLAWLDRKGRAAIDRARAVIAEDVQPALERIRQTRDKVLVTAPDVVRRAVEAAAVAIGDLVAMSDLLAAHARAGLQHVKEAAGAFIDDTRRRFRAFRIVWTRSPATDALVPRPAPAAISIVVCDGTTDVIVRRVPGDGLPFQDCFSVEADVIACPEMVVIPAEPPFAIGRFALTFDEWDAAQAHPQWQMHAAIAPRKANDQSWGRGKQPAIDVSWEDAKAYCRWLSKVSSKSYRLPSESEWELCCRAGTSTGFWLGDQTSTDQANYNGNYPLDGGQKGEYRQRTMPVDSFEPNPWGLYQVHGNVWEWCEDQYDKSSRVLRGGSWNSNAGSLRSANRDAVHPDGRSNNVGFRVARTLLQPFD
jgi:Sulfatase-modifying factor enzyme 1/TIR domain